MLYDIIGGRFETVSLQSEGTLTGRHSSRRYHTPEHRLPGRGRPSARQGLHSSRKLSASDLQLVLLALLDQTPRHGYELIKSLDEHSNGFYVPSPGTVYPALTYLTEIGFTGFEAIANKKLYHVTDAGRKHFEENRAAATQILSDLKRFGSQASPARLAVEAGSGIAIDDEAISDELDAIRRELRRAERERGPLPFEESRRIAGILDRAATEIRLGPQAQLPPRLTHPPHNDHASHLAQIAGPPSGPGGKGRKDAPAGNDRSAFVSPAQADFIYILCRALGATRVAESVALDGLSAMYLATAVRDNGGGLVISNESDPDRANIARRNLKEAGLASFVDVREGDARETLRELGDIIDLMLIGSQHVSNGEPTARQVLDIVAPQMRIGGIVLTANAEPGYLAYIRDPANGFSSMPLPFKESTELSVKVR